MVSRKKYKQFVFIQFPILKKEKCFEMQKHYCFKYYINEQYKQQAENHENKSNSVTDI